MKKVIEMLKANGRVNDWKINLHRRESSELFFVKGELDCVRRTDTTNNRVTVYVDHDGFRGDSQFFVYASTTDEQLAALIDEAGLKGFAVGRAAISTKHAGFAVNLGGATAADVRGLLTQVSDKVFENTGIRLEPEVRIW